MRPALALFALVPLAAASAQESTPAPQETAPAPRAIRAMRYPSLSPDGARIAFSYRGDLWTVPVSGGEAKRVLEQPGQDVRPRWSPDGKTLAYCTDLHGNQDLYTIPATGGMPKRITFHTAEDTLGDWSPDGKRLLFYSNREGRTTALYTVEVDGGRIRQLTRDEQMLTTPQFSPNGDQVAYVRGGSGWARKGYRGSANSELYTLSLEPGAQPQRMTQTAVNEGWPLYSGDGRSLYYTSDVDGTGNLWRLPTAGGKPVQVTRQREGYVHYPAISRDGKTLVYETDFSLWTVDLTARQPAPKRLTVTAAVKDEPRIESRRHTSGATEMELSPDGTQIVLGIKGDLFLMPAEGGDAKLLTESLARDYDPAWSPDGRHIVYVSERDANVDLYSVELATGVTRRLTTDPQPDTEPTYSPDGQRLAFLRGANGRQILTMPASGGPDQVVLNGAFLRSPRWSPDSRWIAYTRRTHAAITNVFAIPARGGESVNVSRWSGLNHSPVWSPDGRRLAFFSARSGTTEIYSVDLRKPGVQEPASAVAPAPEAAGPLVSIDAPGIDRRVKQLIMQPSGGKGSLVYTADGKKCLFTVISGGSLVAYSVPVMGGSADRVAEGMGSTIRPTPDGSALYSLSNGAGLIRKVPLSGGSSTPISFSASVSVDLAEERRQTFDQAWRLQRDNFYDPQMHGVDWAAIRARYRPMVDECLTLGDFHLLLTEMIGELNASHTGTQLTNTPRMPNETGSLGLWFDWSWDGPGLKVSEVMRDGPADQAGGINPGDYLLVMDEREVSGTERFWELLGGQVEKPVEVLVNSKPQKEGARKVKLTPVSRNRFTDLLYEHTVLRTREAVDRLSGGKLAYLHIRAMDAPSLQRFERELLTEAYDREGLVLDVRNNPGGRIHDDLFALLTRKVHIFETPRDALKMTQPFGAFTKPVILLINQGSFSDAEIFANGFRANGLGKIVGAPTGGGVIGTNNLPLLDGETTWRVPSTAWHTLEGTNLENYGVPPDFPVELLPGQVLQGQDPQLETAVRELLKQISNAARKPQKR